MTDQVAWREIGGHEIARHEIAGRENAGMKLQDMKPWRTNNRKVVTETTLECSFCCYFLNTQQ